MRELLALFLFLGGPLWLIAAAGSLLDLVRERRTAIPGVNRANGRTDR